MQLFIKMRRFSLFFVVLVFVFAGCQTGSPAGPVTDRTNASDTLIKPYVVLVSLDGFRSDYVDLYSPPFLNEFRKQGTQAEYMLPVYPSKTFTNHLSMITGLYAENHGIVANSFYDPERHEMYSLRDRAKVTDPSWYGGEPLWVTAEKQGMLSATYFWPGSEAPIGGVRPSYFYEFNKSTEPEVQTRQVLQWLKLPAQKRPHLISIYFHQVDTAGHAFGPDSKQVKEAVLKLDRVLGDFYHELNALNLPVHLVLVSDHGMQALDPSKVVYVEDYVQSADVQTMGDGPLMLVYANHSQDKNRIFKSLKKAENHYKVFQREKFPKNYHFAKTPRAGDFILVPEAPYSLAKNREGLKKEAGGHGYDPDTTATMRAIFYASGPKIKKQFQLKPFRNVNLFPFLSEILQIKTPSKMDGVLEVLAPALEQGSR
jgi:alkaline phosphatase D